MRIDADYLIVGSGVAGLYFALKAAEVGSVALLTKSEARESNTSYAQGGIASVTDPGDSTDIHRRDTLEAGDGLCHEGAVEVAVREGPTVIDELIEIGTRFSRTEEGELSLGREGGHSRHRIVHADDLTGLEVSRSLEAAVRSRASVRIYEHHLAADLIVDASGVCRGVHAIDVRGGDLIQLVAPVTLLATGGAGQIYSSTTNPEVATGDGIAMAYRAGATVGNMEFLQFHPTMLHDPAGGSFLISEAMRGYGAVLVNESGEAFLEGRHPRGSLATRDVVSRAIVAEMKRGASQCVYLDATAKDPAATRRRFPNISRYCLERGIDMTSQPIPVIPAAHYLCGGVTTDMDGQTDVPGLYAAGEVAHTGLHGANRLASNSLLEALVFASRAAVHATSSRPRVKEERLPEWPLADRRVGDTEADRAKAFGTDERQRIQVRMWDDVGIVRTDDGLRRACEDLAGRVDDIEARCVKEGWTPNLLATRSISSVAQLVANGARMRKESRGVHYNSDHPERDDAHWQHDTLFRVSR
ncbi:L-aspartate oxidase [Candidatus Latescibacterota bacterium]